MVYRNDIDGLRAVAILPVLFFHAGFDVASGGFVGVDVFFVISGYLITALILKEKQAGTFSLVHFYERRARRILPALFFVMLCCLPIGWLWLLPNDLDRLADSMIAVVLFVSNIHFYNETGYFAPDADEQPLLHTWSLSIEEQFYLLFPLLIMAVWSRGRGWLTWSIAIIAALSLLAAQFGGHLANIGTLIAGKAPFTSVPESGFYLLPTRAWELLAGALAALNRHDRPAASDGSEILSMAGLAMILYAIIAFDEQTPHPSFHTLIPVGGTVLIILFATPSTLAARLLSNPLLVGIGLISYSVYLWHQPLFAFLRLLAPGQASPSAFLGLAALSLVLGWLSWRFVEQPFRDRKRFSRRQIFRYAGVAGCALFGLGMLGHIHEGFIGRFPRADQDLIAAADRGKMGRYVYSRYKPYLDRPFERDSRQKILVIGDSFGQDFINMLAESGALDQASLSIHEIASPCGNLYLETSFREEIATKHLGRCLNDGWYESEGLKKRLREADIVFLVSAWSPWVAERLPKSLANLERDFDAKLLVIGTKFFGRIDPGRYLGWRDDAKRSWRNPIAGTPIETNRLMSETLGEDVFVDLVRLFCGDDRDCPIFTPDLKLVSYDGSHLTREGARHLGELVTKHPPIRDALSQPLLSLRQ